MSGRSHLLASIVDEDSGSANTFMMHQPSLVRGLHLSETTACRARISHACFQTSHRFSDALFLPEDCSALPTEVWKVFSLQIQRQETFECLC